MKPEFSRTVRIDGLGEAPKALSIEADEGERGALAARFGLAGIERLAAELALTRKGEAVMANGRLVAAVTQYCVASGLPVPAAVDEAFAIVFRPEPESGDEEVELSEAELDVVFYNGASVDVGEAVADSLALGLDPYPRSPKAEAALRKFGVQDEAQAAAVRNPFATLGDKFGR